jgi:hypothetical protein
MKMKRSKTLIAFLTFLAGMTSTTSFAYDIVVPNEDGIAIYYSWTNNKTELAVSYSYSYMVESGRLVIPANVSYQGTVYPVTSLEDGVFYFCPGLKSIILPNTMTSISNEAFYYCENLTNVVIPSSVKTIGNSAFNGCKSLKGVVIPNSVTSIGNDAFCSCDNLTDVVIPSSVKSIGLCAFYICQNLTNVTLSDSITTIGGWAFAGCPKLTSITIPASVISIDECAFQGDIGVSSVKIYCNEIGPSWFAGLSNLKDVVIDDNVKSIGPYAFACTGLNDITIPASVTSIGENAFNYCTYLKKVVIEGSPDIYDEAFADCDRIDSIVLKSQTPPKMICSTYDDYHPFGAFFTEYTYEHAVLSVPAGYYDAYSTSDVWSRFNNICTYFYYVYEADFENDSIYYTFHDDGIYVAARSANGNNGYNGDGPLTPRDPASAGHQPRTQTRSTPQTTTASALDYTSYRGNIVIPESVSVYDTVYTVTGINYLAFQGCNELESVTIPQSVKQIGYAGFAECTGLTEITIPAGVELIDQYAFAYCTSLKRVVIEGNPVIDETAFIGCRTDLEVIMAGNKDNEASDPDLLSDGSIHYGIDGQIIQPNTPGLHLIKRKDGTVVKALVR